MYTVVWNRDYIHGFFAFQFCSGGVCLRLIKKKKKKNKEKPNNKPETEIVSITHTIRKAHQQAAWLLSLHCWGKKQVYRALSQAMMFTWCFVITKLEQLLFYSQHPPPWPGIITWFLGGITNSTYEPATSEGKGSLKSTSLTIWRVCPLGHTWLSSSRLLPPC